MFEGIKGLFAKTPEPPTGEIAANESIIYRGTNITQYNPDRLVRVKGGLKVYDEMRLDDQVKACLSLKKQAILAPGWEVEPATEDNPQDQEIADFVTDIFQGVDGSFEYSLWEMLSAMDFGYSLQEKIWKTIEVGRWSGKWGLKALKSKRPHFYTFDVDEFSNIKPDGLVQTGLATSQVRLPADKFVIYSYQKEFGNWYGTSDLRTAYRAWWSKDNIVKFWNMSLERFGMPMILAKLKTSDPSKKQEVDNILNNIQAKTSIVAPDGLVDFSFLESEQGGSRRGGQSPYEQALAFHNRAIARSILIPDRLIEAGEVGAYAQSRTHFDVFLWVIQKARAELEETVVQEQLVRQIVEWNFAGITELPKFRFKPLTEDMKVDFAAAFAEAVQKGAVIPNHEDGNVIRERLGFPEAEEPVEVEGGEGIESPTKEPNPKEKEPKPKKGDETFAKRTKKTSVEDKVDFGKVEETLTTKSEATMEAYKEVLTKQRDSLTSFVSTKMSAGKLTSNIVRQIELKFSGELKRITKEMYNDCYMQGVKDGKSELPRNFVTGKQGMAVVPDKALSYFDAKSDFVVRGIKEPLVTSTQSILLNSIRTGETVPVTTKKLQDAYEPYLAEGDVIIDEKQLTAYRLEAITRTNINEAYNYGRRAVGEDPELEGFVVGYQFSEIMDDRTVEVSRFVDGKVIGLNNPALDQLTYPLHWNERGMFVYVTKDEGPVTFMSDAEVGQALALKGI